MTTATKFQAHVHPETYTVSDPIEYRQDALHTRKSDCTHSDCTFATLTPAAREQNLEATRMLRKAIAADKRASKNRDSDLEYIPGVGTTLPVKTPRIKAPAKLADAKKMLAEQTAAAAPKPPRKNTERRNEMPHEDARGAVQFHACPTCKAKKAANCIAGTGKPTNHVHAARMAKWDTLGGS
jgi:hypothetical protein